ncbi:MAG: hypothetical protein R3C60_14635 [Parvularculaceae bacterium]
MRSKHSPRKAHPDRLKPLGVWKPPGQSAISSIRAAKSSPNQLDGEGILYAEGGLEIVRAAKAACDIAGHYSRPDIFDLTVDRSQRPAARFSGDADSGPVQRGIWLRELRRPLVII